MIVIILHEDRDHHARSPSRCVPIVTTIMATRTKALAMSSFRIAGTSGSSLESIHEKLDQAGVHACRVRFGRSRTDATIDTEGVVHHAHIKGSTVG
jgi:hypothetical protein